MGERDSRASSIEPWHAGTEDRTGEVAYDDRHSLESFKQSHGPTCYSFGYGQVYRGERLVEMGD